MFVNIWATVTHLSDAFFASDDDQATAGLDLLIGEYLFDATGGRQMWMVNPLWLPDGTGSRLLRESYALLRDSDESYLVIYTPGFADLVAGCSLDLAGRQCLQLARRARNFNKRMIVQALGIPPKAPDPIVEMIEDYNGVIADAVSPFDGVVADLSDIEYEPWSASGSRPVNHKSTARLIAEAVLQSHAQADAWKNAR